MSYSREEIKTALQVYQKIKSMPKTIEILGYPSLGMLSNWRRMYPELCSEENQRRHRRWKHASLDLKLEAIRRCYINGESIKSVATDIGYSSPTIIKWYQHYSEKGLLYFMKPKEELPKAESAEDIEALKAQIQDMQMEIDILKETINVIKKDPGVNLTKLANREKTVIVDALRDKYSLSKLLKRLNLPKSTYSYQRHAMQAEDKYKELRCHITELFHENRDVYGYRRIHISLKAEGTTVSEKVVRRLMQEEGLVVKPHKKRKYSSYMGEISPAVENIVARDFHAESPNEKWLTDITEFSIPAGKVYLSPIIDCFDGMPIVWTSGTSPNADLVNTMLEAAIEDLSEDEKPIVHSDRGGHYRWPEWIRIMEENGLTRSMSKKGCSPDNSACEGFFGHLKTEFFYDKDWSDYSIDEFIRELDNYIYWYCEDRIKITLGGLSPLDYRRSMGIAV